MLVLILLVAFGASAEVSRSGATTQRESNNAVAPLRRCVRNPLPQSTELPIEVFQILDLPLTVHEASLVKTERALLLKLALGNSSELKMVGLRYSLVTIDSKNQMQFIANRIEGFSIPGYGTKTVTFKTPLRFKSKDSERLVLMVEQVISRESIWEVVKAKDALEAYARGDYSVVPVVLRVPNAVDAPDRPRVIFQKYRF